MNINVEKTKEEKIATESPVAPNVNVSLAVESGKTDVAITVLMMIFRTSLLFQHLYFHLKI